MDTPTNHILNILSLALIAILCAIIAVVGLIVGALALVLLLLYIIAGIVAVPLAIIGLLVVGLPAYIGNVARRKASGIDNPVFSEIEPFTIPVGTTEGEELVM